MSQSYRHILFYLVSTPSILWFVYPTLNLKMIWLWVNFIHTPMYSDVEERISKCDDETKGKSPRPPWLTPNGTRPSHPYVPVLNVGLSHVLPSTRDCVHASVWSSPSHISLNVVRNVIPVFRHLRHTNREREKEEGRFFGLYYFDCFLSWICEPFTICPSLSVSTYGVPRWRRNPFLHWQLMCSLLSTLTWTHTHTHSTNTLPPLPRYGHYARDRSKEKGNTRITIVISHNRAAEMTAAALTTTTVVRVTVRARTNWTLVIPTPPGISVPGRPAVTKITWQTTFTAARRPNGPSTTPTGVQQTSVGGFFYVENTTYTYRGTRIRRFFLRIRRPAPWTHIFHV